MSYELHLGDCIATMRAMPDNSVDAIVTDPPYELGFMGKAWDASGIAYSVEMWREALRVLKPGGHLLAFSGSRTYHRMAVAIEDAGFDIRDQIMWVYGSGFPKSQNISKAIDKQAGAAREVISEGKAIKRMIPGADQDATGSWIKDNGREYVPQVTRAATVGAEQWEGWGTALKPAHEPICVARKPLAKGLTVAANVLQFGTGAVNIDGCRVGDESTRRATLKIMTSRGAQGDSYANQDHRYADRSSSYPTGSDAGRWPANIIHDGSQEVVALFPEQESGSRAAGVRMGMGFHGADGDGGPAIAGSAGSAARFFYCAKASRADRNEGLVSPGTAVVTKDATMRDCETADWSARNGNHHPTVKPTALMAYLVRLVTPPGGLVLDPFMGSGSTGKACMREGFRFTGIDLTPEYVEIARARIAHELAQVALANTPSPAPQFDLFAMKEAVA
jgi:DNA modification methylase